MVTYDAVVRDGYVQERDSLVDIAVTNGSIVAVGTVSGEGQREIDAGGGVVTPGLVDAHVHYDMAFGAEGKRRPRLNQERGGRETNMERTAEYFAETDPETVTRRAKRAIRRAVANGILHARAQTYVDGDVGTDIIEAVADARDACEELMNLELVAFPQQGFGRDPGSIAAARRAIDVGADLVGGIDPAGVNDDIEETIDTWFDVATEHDVPIDAHVHDPGSVGRKTIRHFATVAVERGYQGRVATSHAYALTPEDGPDEDLQTTLETAEQAGMSFITCYMSTPPGMPVARIEQASGLAHGTDQVRDLWSPHGNCDVLQGAMVESLKLGYHANPQLQALWELITRQSARVLDIPGYGIVTDTPADLVIYDAPSPEWAIVEQDPPTWVLREGQVVAREGEITTDHGGP